MKKIYYTIAIVVFLTSSTYAQTFQWAKQLGGSSSERGQTVFTDAAGNVYTTGYFNGTADFDPGAGVSNLTAIGITDDIFVSKLDANGNFVWAKGFGGNGASGDWGYGITVDGAGNVYTTGYFSGTGDFDPGAGITNLTSAGNTDIFISKLDASGNFQWAKSFGSTSQDIGFSIMIDASGNVVTTGHFFGTIDFDPGAGVFNMTASSQDMFVSKLDASGNFLWAKQSVSSIACSARGMTQDAVGNMYFTGIFRGTTDFDFSAATFNVSSVNAGNNDAFVLKLDPNGLLLWAKKLGGTDEDDGFAIALDASGNVYTTGVFNLTCDFDPSASVSNLTSFGAYDSYVSKLDNSGNFVWAKQLGGAGNDLAQGIAVDGSGNVWTIGYFDAIADFDPGAGVQNLTPAGGSGQDAYYSKLTSAGNFSAALQIGSTGADVGNGITVDASGYIYSTGYFQLTTDFDPGAGISNMTCIGGIDVYVHKMASCSGAPSQPGTISGSVTICSGNTPSYSVAAVAGATAYTWSLPSGWTGSSTTNIINTTASATSGSITVSANNVCGSSVVQTLSVTVNTTPSTPSAISGSITICSGNTPSYSITTVAGATSYNWTLPSGWTGSSSTNVINTTASANSGNITVSATNMCGTSALQTLSVTVNTIPATPGSISGSVTICSGNTPSYSVATVAGAASYNWSLPAGWTGSSATNIINATASANSGNVTVSASNMCGTSAVQTLSVTVNTTPATPGSISGVTSKCSGSPASNYSIVAVTGATSYTWSLPIGWTGSSATNIISATPGSSGIFTVTATNACGTSAQQTLSVTINALPIIGVNSGSICSGSSFTIVPSGASTYTIQGGSAVVSPGSTTSYTVIGTSTAGCISSGFATSNVTVNTTPTVSMASGTICPGGSFTLSASGASTYTYSSGPVVSPAVTTTYSAVGSSTAGCNSSSTTAVVTVTNNLVVSITGTNTICSGQSVNLTANGASTYTWNTTATTTTIAPTPTANTTYSIIGASGSCSNSALFTVTVNPTPTITAFSNNPVLCLGSGLVAILTASGATNYVWTPGGPGTSITVSPSVTTTYTINGTSANGCTSTAVFTQTVTDCTGLTTITSNNIEVSVYPNPFSSIITISSNSKTGIEVFNILGTKVYSTTIEIGKTEIDLSNQSKGIYFMKIGSVTKKIIKE
jgi:hypothetical protein